MADRKLPRKLKNGITAQQDKFARNVASGKTVTESARLAGYTGNDGTLAATGSRLLKKDKIKAAVNEYADRAADKAVLDAAFVLGNLMRNAELGQTIGPDGKPVGLGPSTQALGLLGKHLRLFVDRTQVEFGTDVRRLLDSLVDIIDTEVSDPEVRGRIVARLADLGGAGDGE